MFDGPLGFTTPRTAHMWLVYWDAWVTPKLRANAADLPDELVAYVEAARRLAAVHVASMTSAVGSAVDEEAEAGASSADGDETSERERSGSTTAEVAGARLGLSGRQVRNLLRQGRLAGEQVGRTWVVDDAAIEDYRTRRAEAG